MCQICFSVVFSFWQEPWQSSAGGIPLPQRGSKHRSDRPGCVPSASLPGWTPAGWCLGRARLCIPAQHPALIWELEGPIRSLGHLLGMFCQRSCCVQHDSIQAACGTFSFIPVPQIPVQISVPIKFCLPSPLLSTSFHHHQFCSHFCQSCVRKGRRQDF